MHKTWFLSLLLFLLIVFDCHVMFDYSFLNHEHGLGGGLVQLVPEEDVVDLFADVGSEAQQFSIDAMQDGL